MQSEEKKDKEAILEPYLSQINDIRKTMEFQTFENDKPYSFDYHLKEKFDDIVQKIDLESKKKTGALISPSLTNRLPIFLPPKTNRISFFSYKSKSVRAIDINKLESILARQAHKRCRNGEFSYNEIDARVKEDLALFNTYHKEHNFKDYRTDISTTTIQFNAYDKNDNLLIEKSFVRGGLVFDMQPEEFEEKISVSYPRYRKQRSDKKEDYLPLKLMKIRGIKTDGKSTV
jgi:hypothetical protein